MPQAKKKAAAQPRSRTRAYTVVRIDGDKLTVVDPARDAANHDAAMNAVASNMKPEDRNCALGAFPASSYREMEFETAQTFVTSKKRRSPSFNGSAPVSAPPAINSQPAAA